MTNKVEFYSIPGRSARDNGRIYVRDGSKNLIGTIIWHHTKEKEVSFTPAMTGNQLSVKVMQQIYELMESIETGFVELVDMVLLDSQEKKASQNVGDAR